MEFVDSSITLMDLVEPILSEHYNGLIGSEDFNDKNWPRSFNDDFTIVRLMDNQKCIGYRIQIYQYYTDDTPSRREIILIRRSDNLGFCFAGPHEFYYKFYNKFHVHPRNIPNFIKNFKLLITTDSVDINYTSWDLDPVTNTGEKKFDTHKFKLCNK
jgi:hypothetical protein